MYCLEEFLNKNEKKKAFVNILIFLVRLTQRLIPLHNVNRALRLTKGMRRLYHLPKEEANSPPQYEQSLTLFSKPLSLLQIVTDQSLSEFVLC